MAAIIYEKTPGALTPTGDRAVSTFPSGLVRVDQTFSCKTSVATTHRIALAVGSNFPNGSYPAIDGLKIYPEVQETQRGDGFTEFKVSAYGRTTANLNYIMKAEKQRLWNFGYTLVDGGQVSGQSAQIDATYYKVDGILVILKGQDLSVEELNLPSEFSTLKGILRVVKNLGEATTGLYNVGETNYDYFDWNGISRINKYITYKYWHGTVGLDGKVDPTNSVASYLVYDLPVIRVNKETNYGNFTELEISVCGRAIDSNYWPTDE